MRGMGALSASSFNKYIFKLIALNTKHSGSISVCDMLPEWYTIIGDDYVNTTGCR